VAAASPFYGKLPRPTADIDHDYADAADARSHKEK
jgi:hypothetical protein